MAYETIEKCLNNFSDLEGHALNCENETGLLILRKNYQYFPSKRSLGLTTGGNLQKIEECQETPSRLVNVCLHPVRIIVTNSGLRASLQVFNREIEVVDNVLSSDKQKTFQVSEAFQILLSKLSAKEGYEICRGLFPQDAKVNNDLLSGSKSLEVSTYPFVRIFAKKCMGLTKDKRKNYKPAESEFEPLDASYRCAVCREYLRLRNKKSSNTPENAPTSKKPKTDPSSSFNISLLSPKSKKIRFANMKKERASLMQSNLRLKRKISQLLAPLSDSQSDEMGERVKQISDNFSDDLENVSDATGDKERTKRSIWKEDRRKLRNRDVTSFLADQNTNKPTDPFIIKVEPKEEQECCIKNCEFQRQASKEQPIVLNAFPAETFLKEIWCQKVKILSPNWNGVTENAYVCHSHLLKFPTLLDNSEEAQATTQTALQRENRIPNNTTASSSNRIEENIQPLLIRIEPPESLFAPLQGRTEFILPTKKDEKDSKDAHKLSYIQIKEEPEDILEADESSEDDSTFTVN